MPSKYALATGVFAACVATSIWNLSWSGQTGLHGAISIGCFSLLTAASIFVWRRDRKQSVARESMAGVSTADSGFLAARTVTVYANSLFVGLGAASVLLGWCWSAGLVTWYVATMIGLTLVTISGWQLRQWGHRVRPRS